MGYILRKVKRLMFSALLLIFINGCNVSNEDIFQYNDSYIGDNNAVSHILSYLPSSEHLKGFELKTKEEPYGININYNVEIEQDYEETVIYNGTFLLSLIQNVDSIKFNFGDLEYNITKERLEEWYERDLNEFTNEEELKNFVQEQLENESKVKLIFE
ncbi:DUF4825 domain-containing protein [Metabacillus niabensis]|uniref:DUF4825 domain-containing protein n=1 Tax=Metabacillus niabensis TaxID=324854 RepID=UPI001CFA705D|nr:DUF4825 domain-containing protein [Metabacillus niabensis]